VIAGGRIVAPCKAMGGENRECGAPFRAHGITARSSPEPAIENPEIAEIFDLPDARSGATVADFCAVLGERHV